MADRKYSADTELAAAAATGDFYTILDVSDTTDGAGGTSKKQSPANLTQSLDAASATLSGRVELATTAETDTGTDAARALTPAGLAGSALQTKVNGVEALADVTDAVNVGSSIAGATAKSALVNADSIATIDSEAANVLKETTWTSIKAFLKTYFDTLYNNYTHPNHTGHVTSTADGAQVLGAFTVAQLSTALSDATISGNNSGDELAASLTVSGTVEVATQAEVDAGTDALRTVSPSTLENSAARAEVTANTAKTTNATHTGQVTGATALTLDVTSITDQSTATAVGADTVIIVDATDGALKKSLVSDFASAGGDMAAATYDAATIAEQLVGLTATQTLTNKTINDSTNDVGADEVHIKVKNQTGSTITKGSAVYISGYHVGSNLIQVTLADTDSAATMPAIGLVKADITHTSDGLVVATGELNGFDTSAFSVGDALYVSGTAGGLTATKPVGTAEIQKVAICTRSHATLGIVQLFGAGRTNDVPNLANTKVWIGDSNGVPAQFALSGGATMDAGGVVTVATNANLTGHITSTGNAAILGSFTVAQLSTALSDASISGNNTGDEVAADLTTAGVIEIATGAETNTGTDATRAVSPDGLDDWTGSAQVVTVGAGAVTAHIAAIKPTESFIIACSDETTDLTTGTNKVKFRMPYAFTVTGVRASLSTVATGATLLTVDINDSGTSILSTKLTFDASESTTTTATTAAVISDSALADDAEITIDIDAVGNTTTGKGLKVAIIGTRT